MQYIVTLNAYLIGAVGLFVGVCTASAQNVKEARAGGDSLAVESVITMPSLLEQPIVEPVPTHAETYNLGAKRTLENEKRTESTDSFRIPRWGYKPALFTVFQPWNYLGSPFWDIHVGLNVNLDLGVSVGFGKNNPFKGGSFYSNLSLLYAKQLNNRWTVAAGATLSRFKIWNENVNTLSVEAMAAYRINDKLTAIVYGSHSFGNLGSPLYMPPYMGYGKGLTNIGAELNVKVNDSFSFQIGVSHTNYEQDGPPKRAMFNDKR